MNVTYCMYYTTARKHGVASKTVIKLGINLSLVITDVFISVSYIKYIIQDKLVRKLIQCARYMA